MSVLEDLSEEERYLYSILQDPSGIDLHEFAVYDPQFEDGCFRAWPFQWNWWSDISPKQIDMCARSIGKSLSIRVRMFAFPFLHPGHEAVITAPELVHLEPITGLVERVFYETRLGREMLQPGKSGVTHRPFMVVFRNGSRIIGRIPQRDGKGVKGIHPLWLELDEAQDYPEPGWVELTETLKRGVEGAVYRAHGVTRGGRDRYFFKYTTDPESGWRVHRHIAPDRPNWTDEERQEKIKDYGGSKDDPDYRRNVFGEHGDATSPMFVLHRFMNCWASDTLVKVVNDNEEPYSARIADVAVGSFVVNAIGKGRVLRNTPSIHSKIVRLVVDGETLNCSLDHSILTQRGWIEAQDLVQGDYLVPYQTLHGMWKSDIRQREKVLFDLLSRRRSKKETCPGMSDMWRKSKGRSEQVLLDRLRWEVASNATAISGMPILSESIDRSRSTEILFNGMCVQCSNSKANDCTFLRDLCSGVEYSTRTVLLENVWREIRWSELSGIGYQQTHIDNLWNLWKSFLPGFQESEVLFDGLCREVSRTKYDKIDSNPMFSLWERIQTIKDYTSFLFQGMLVRRQKKETSSQSRPSYEKDRSRRSSFTAIPTMERPGGSRSRLGASVLDESSWGDRICYLVGDRYCQSQAKIGDRSGWTRTLRTQNSREGCESRRMASFSRVDSVEILQPGDPEFDRLSGGEDFVTCYDLTVSGHPSFCVGKNGVVVHNCVDDDTTSHYNAEEYFKVDIKGETVTKYNQDIATLLDFPSGHLNYASDQRAGVFWIGMDVGYLNHPSEILVFVEYRMTADEIAAAKKAKQAVPDDGKRMKLLSRIHLARVSHGDQVKAILWTIGFYHPRVFAMDRTGLGLPLFQDLQEKASDDPTVENALEIIKGYNFSSKILVDFDNTIKVDEFDDPIKKAGIERNVLEYASDRLRSLVDDRHLWLPWDRDLLAEYQGQTYTVARNAQDQYGRKVYNKGKFHALDASRMAALGHAQFKIEQFVATQEAEETVLDMFMGA